jgi:hypothetical protein
VASGDCDWQRFYWTGLAARRGFGPLFYDDVLFWLPWFEKGEMGRVLHTAAPVLGECLDEARATVFGVPVEEGKLVQIRRVVLLYEAMMDRAKRAIACWSMAGRRCGVVKDMRVTIAKMAWKEAWRWGENGRGGAADEVE